MIDNKQTTDMNREKFLKLIEENNVKFTEPQERFVQRIRDGWSYRIKDAHRMDGGTMVWVSEDGYEDYGGRMFALLKNVHWAFRKQTGEDSELSSWLKIK